VSRGGGNDRGVLEALELNTSATVAKSAESLKADACTHSDSPRVRTAARSGGSPWK
jgi:hypothetical protein